MVHDLIELLRTAWQERPTVVVLSIVAVCVLLFVLVDTHLHRKKRKKSRQGRREH